MKSKMINLLRDVCIFIVDDIIINGIGGSLVYIFSKAMAHEEKIRIMGYALMYDNPKGTKPFEMLSKKTQQRLLDIKRKEKEKEKTTCPSI